MVIRVGFKPRQFGRVASIGEGIEIDEILAGVFLKPVMNQVGTNETSTPGDQDDNASKQCTQKINM